MARISRRNVLIGGAVAATATVPLGFLGSYATSSHAEIIAGHLRQALPGLAISDTNLKSFANEYLARNEHGRKFFLMMSNSMLADAAPGDVRTEYVRITRDLLTRFLFSTDFFGAGGQRPADTSYIDYSDPYLVACSNPLAQFGPST